MKFSPLVEMLSPSATVAIADNASSMQRRGLDVIGLAAGEPDFPTPAHIKQAAYSAIGQNFTRYTEVAGLYALRNIVSRRYEERFKLKYAAENVVMGAGAKQVVFNALLSTLTPDDEVVLIAPFWVSYADIAKMCGATVRVLRTAAQDGFIPAAAELRKLVNDRTRWLIINNPNNPTGAIYDRETLAGIADIVRDFPNLWVMSDDIYEYIVYAGGVAPHILQVAPDLQSRTLVVSGFSKAYSMTGWRLGYAVGDGDLVAAMVRLQSQSTTNANTISQHAAIAALEGSHLSIEDNNRSLLRRRDLCHRFLVEEGDFECVVPEGAFYLFPALDKYIGRVHEHFGLIANGNDFVRFLLEVAHVAVVPGSAFGADSHFRLSFVSNEELLRKACSRIVDGVRQLRQA
ncbi:pyridoxal phosphate-dependent aminotransferase [Rhizobium laguerreae]|uniref:pyridoxal phosphate-dependent aminotransferase n=1 Tax=Rhizobium laguerreae TaxID=1076926 RepID=UPI001C90A73C|nr:pyridoxal phosphate-dependent aminotransferase [Rhizobium laguerreae]MBY3561757.1 pyridoxal phosphate-dependent aminotransferase [Rhizobium laguerreae]